MPPYSKNGNLNVNKYKTRDNNSNIAHILPKINKFYIKKTSEGESAGNKLRISGGKY